MSDHATEADNLVINSLSKARQTQDPDFAIEDVPNFVTHSVPPCDNNTRLIAVCGVTNALVEQVEFEFNLSEGADHPRVVRGRCDPKSEGWLIADFYAFKVLYKDTCASQAWLHCEDPQDLVTAYEEYLHGNPYKERRVVLDQALIDDGLGQDVVVVPRAQLKQQFCVLLKREARLARKNGQKLLVMTMALGHEESYAINLGERDNNNDWFRMEDFKKAVISDSDLRKGAVKTDLDITYLTTACFSGGWTIQNDLNTTMFAATGPEDVRASWITSPSIGRYSGGIYPTAIMQAWNEEFEDALVIPSSSASSSEQRTFASFDKEVYDTLLGIDENAQQHDIRFSAQDDNWETSWTTRSGIPLESFEQKWKRLRIVPSSKPDGALNTISSNKQLSGEIRDQATGGFRGRFDTLSSAREFVRFQANLYLNSFPGQDNLAPNTTLHGNLRRLMVCTNYVTFSQLDSISVQLRYRLSLSHRATWLVKAAKLPLPQGRCCNQFDEVNFQKWRRENPGNDVSQRYTFAVRKIFANVLPTPTNQQGMIWNKPNHYIACAIASDNTIKDKAQLEAAVQRLERLAAEDLKRVLRDLEYIPEIRSQKRAIFAKIGKRVRSLSPDRIHRKRADTGAAKLGSASEFRSAPTSPEGKDKGKDPVKY